MKAKKLLSWLLTLTMVFGLLPGMGLTASATDSHNHVGWTEWTTANELPTSAGNYYLTVDVNLTSPWEVPGGETNLCLNGHVIQVEQLTTDCYQAINVGANTLNLYDCPGGAVHKFKEDVITVSGVNKTRWILDEENGTHTINGGCIVGAKPYKWGCVIYVKEKAGAFTMNGGTIAGNIDCAVRNKGSFTMNGGTIRNNNGSACGGVNNEGTFTMNGGYIIDNNVVSNSSPCAGGVNNNSIFTMNGGTISGNTLTASASWQKGCAGVSLAYGTKFKMSGGSITGNLSMSDGSSGGVYCITGYENVIIGGTARISGNKLGTALDAQDATDSNVELNGAYITLGTGSNDVPVPADSMEVYIHGNEGTIVVDSGATADDTKYFKADKSDLVAKHLDGKINLMSNHDHSFTYSVSVDGAKIIATCGNDGCNITDSKVELTLSASDANYSGSAVTVCTDGTNADAVIKYNLSAWTAAEAGAVTVKYVGREGTTYDSETAPTEVGKYTVKISPTSEGATPTHVATADFEITKAAASVSTAPTGKDNLTYSGSAQALVNAGTVVGGTLQYSTTETGTYSATIPTGTNAGSYSVWYKVVGDANHNDTTAAKVDVTIAKATPTITTNPTASAITYGQTLVDSALTGGVASTDGSFAWKEPTTAPAVANSNTTNYTVVFTPTDAANYNTVEFSVTLTVNKKPVAASIAIIAPKANETAQTELVATEDFNVAAITWSPDLKDGKFEYSKEYTAEVALSLKDK